MSLHPTRDDERAAACVAVAPGSHASLSPLGAPEVVITDGLWSRRQAVNRSVSLAACVHKLEEAGNLHNLRLAAGRATGAYRLPEHHRLPFLDSDVYKWLEAVGWELGRAPDPDLERLADEVIELVAAAQGDDGYLNSFWTIAEPGRRWEDLANGHELYCAGHLIQAAVAHARGRGDTTLLDVARRVADDIDREFGDGARQGVPGHPEVEMALVELHRLTGEERYLRLAAYFVDERGKGLAGPHPYGATYFQDHQSVREATTVTGHAVRALYLEAGIVDLYLETGDRALLEASVRRWEAMVATKLYLTGGIGAHHQDEAFGDPHELPPDRAYNETCAAIASIMWSWRLLLATGEARYADLIERTLYNGFLPGFSLDGQRYFYVNTLHARSDPDLAGVVSPNGSSPERQPWFACACCPPNVMRTLSSLEHYLVTSTEGGLQLHQYASGEVTVEHLGDEVELRVTTDYPWEGRIAVEVVRTPASPWALSLRVPGWCTDTTLAVNGAAHASERDREGYVTLTRAWEAGDVVTLDLAMPVRLTEPHPRIDAVRGCLAIERGPLVYCLEEVDLPDGVALEDVELRAGAVPDATFTPDLLGGVVTVTAAAQVRIPVSWSQLLYRSVHGDDGDTTRPVELRAVPYYAWGNRGVGTMRVWIPRA